MVGSTVPPNERRATHCCATSCAASESIWGRGESVLPVCRECGRHGVARPRDVVARPVAEEERAAFASLTAGDIMTTELIVVKPTYTIQDALLLFQQHTVGALPVVDDEGVVRGILSVRDLMRAFVNVIDRKSVV